MYNGFEPTLTNYFNDGEMIFALDCSENSHGYFCSSVRFVKITWIEILTNPSADERYRIDPLTVFEKR